MTRPDLKTAQDLLAKSKTADESQPPELWPMFKALILVVEEMWRELKKREKDVPVESSEKLPTYGLKDSVPLEDWLFKVKQILEPREDEPASIKRAGGSLYGNPSTWYRMKVLEAEREKRLPFASWTEFEDGVRMHETPLTTAWERNMAFQGLRQGNRNIEDYTAAFWNLMTQIPKIPEEQLVGRYVDGLNQEPQFYVSKERPESLKEAARLAREWTTKHGEASRRPRARPAGSYSGKQIVPMELDALRTAPLTEEEREECYRTGSCFKCRQPGHLSRLCPTKATGNDQRQ